MGVSGTHHSGCEPGKGQDERSSPSDVSQGAEKQESRGVSGLHDRWDV